MAGTKTVTFTPQSILNLLTHFSDGTVPLDAELVACGVHPLLTRKIMLAYTSKEQGPGGGALPLEIKYHNRKMVQWSDKNQELMWEDAPDAPRRAE